MHTAFSMLDFDRYNSADILYVIYRNMLTVMSINVTLQLYFMFQLSSTAD